MLIRLTNLDRSATSYRWVTLMEMYLRIYAYNSWERKLRVHINDNVIPCEINTVKETYAESSHEPCRNCKMFEYSKVKHVIAIIDSIMVL